LELLDHPDIITPYTLNEDIANKIKSPKSISEITTPLLKGITDHANRLKVNIKIGDNIKIIKFDELGIIVSFNINLTPSAKAWKNPYKPTTLGPLLR